MAFELSRWCSGPPARLDNPAFLQTTMLLSFLLCISAVGTSASTFDGSRCKLQRDSQTRLVLLPKQAVREFNLDTNLRSGEEEKKFPLPDAHFSLLVSSHLPQQCACIAYPRRCGCMMDVCQQSCTPTVATATRPFISGRIMDILGGTGCGDRDGQVAVLLTTIHRQRPCAHAEPQQR